MHELAHYNSCLDVFEICLTRIQQRVLRRPRDNINRSLYEGSNTGLIRELPADLPNKDVRLKV